MSHVSVTCFCPCPILILKNPNVTCICHLFLSMSHVACRFEEIPMSHVSFAYFHPCPLSIWRNPSVTWPLLILVHVSCRLSILSDPNFTCLNVNPNVIHIMSLLPVFAHVPCSMSILRNPNVTYLCHLLLPMSNVACQFYQIPLSHVSVIIFTHVEFQKWRCRMSLSFSNLHVHKLDVTCRLKKKGPCCHVVFKGRGPQFAGDGPRSRWSYFKKVDGNHLTLCVIYWYIGKVSGWNYCGNRFYW